MSTKHEKLNSLFFLIATLLIIAVMMHINQNNIDSQNNYFEENGLYTISKVIEYSAQTVTGSSAFIRISYKVNNFEYEVESDYNAPSKNGPKEGSLFMSIYLPNEPEKCALLFDYPVKDSSEYKHYIKEFKKNRPKLR